MRVLVMMTRIILQVLRPTAARFAIVSFSMLTGAAGVAVEAQTEGAPDLQTFFSTTVRDDDRADAARDVIAESWRPGYSGIVWDLVRFMAPPRAAPPRSAPFTRPQDLGAVAPIQLEPEHPTTVVWRRLMALLEDKTDLRLRNGLADLPVIQRWMWEQPYDPHPDYAEFKGLWYGQIDPAFTEFFLPGTASAIRLDEVDWGGVPVNGIPPLEFPPIVAGDDASAGYLDDDDIVFGIAVNGAARAYPKRILAWHEMALDRIGDVEMTIVYCTLCGTVIPYESVVDGRHITFGTSGLLYRSNKLMFDQETKSLWNTFEGVPVIGALVDSGVRLTHRSVVTTTWGEWRRTHPQTTVLSIPTGHQRDYSEGAAYREYFSNDRLMFTVPHLDDRLDNKDEVVVLLVEDSAGTRQPLAISVEFLDDNRLFQTEHAARQFLVLTSREGANRVYDVGGVQFSRQLDEGRVEDGAGGIWHVREDALVLGTDETRRLTLPIQPVSATVSASISAGVR